MSDSEKIAVEKSVKIELNHRQIQFLKDLLILAKDELYPQMKQEKETFYKGFSIDEIRERFFFAEALRDEI